MGLPSQDFLHACVVTRGYALQTDVHPTSGTHPTSGVPQGGTEGLFLFLLVTLPLAFYIRRTYPDLAQYPLRTTILKFADDMAVVTATAQQPLPNASSGTTANQVLEDVDICLGSNRLPVHNAPHPPLRPRDPPMTPVSTAPYLGIQQEASSEKVALPADLERQLTRKLVIGCIASPSTNALAFFLQAVLNAAVGFQALHLTQLKQMPRGAVAVMRCAWAIHGHRPTFLSAEVPDASAPYYGDSSNNLVHNVYTAHLAAHLHRLMHNHKPEVQQVFTLALRGARHNCNTCLQYILQQRGLPTTVETRVWNHQQLLLPHHLHVIQTNHRCSETGPMTVLYTDIGGRPTGETTILDQVGTTLHLVRVKPLPKAGPAANRHQSPPLPATPGLVQQVDP